jgi:hypothetical protein
MIKIKSRLIKTSMIQILFIANLFSKLFLFGIHKNEEMEDYYMYRFHSMRDVREITFSEDHTGTLRRGTGKEQQKDTRVVFFDDIPRDLLPRWRLLSYDYLLRASGYRSVECLAGPSKITLIICMRNTLISRAVGNKMATKQHCASGLRYVMQFENNSCLSNLYLNCYSA